MQGGSAVSPSFKRAGSANGFFRRRENVSSKAQITMDAETERSLLAKCRNHDMEAFGRLVDAYQSRVFGFVKRMLPSAEEASDVTQEVFIKAFQNIHRFDGRASVRTWLFRIAHNLCIDRSRRFDRSPSEVSLTNDSEYGEGMDVADYRWSPDEILINAELMQVVEAGIMSMSEKLRSVLIFHDREEMAYEEIAEVMAIPVGTVKSRRFLARAHLKEVVSQYLEEAGR